MIETLLPIIPTITPDNHADLPIESPTPNISFQWRDGGRLLYTRFDHHDQADWNTWENYFRALHAHWPTERTALYVYYDFSSPTCGITRYIDEKSSDLILTARPYRLFGANVLANKQVASLYEMRIQGGRRPPNVSFSFHTEPEKAYKWLNDHMAKYGHTA